MIFQKLSYDDRYYIHMQFQQIIKVKFPYTVSGYKIMFFSNQNVILKPGEYQTIQTGYRILTSNQYRALLLLPAEILFAHGLISNYQVRADIHENISLPIINHTHNNVTIPSGTNILYGYIMACTGDFAQLQKGSTFDLVRQSSNIIPFKQVQSLNILPGFCYNGMMTSKYKLYSDNSTAANSNKDCFAIFTDKTINQLHALQNMFLLYDKYTIQSSIIAKSPKNLEQAFIVIGLPTNSGVNPENYVRPIFANIEFPLKRISQTAFLLFTQYNLQINPGAICVVQTGYKNIAKGPVFPFSVGINNLYRDQIIVKPDFTDIIQGNISFHVTNIGDNIYKMIPGTPLGNLTFSRLYNIGA